MKTPTLSELLHRPVHLLAFGFGTGLSPKAPGTAGTLVGVGVFLAAPLAIHWYLLVIALLSGVGVWICGVSARDLGVHDHPGIVWDEVVGFLITMTALPRSWLWITAGFVVFRMLDILKPWPIKMIDRRVTGGLGIMLDDVLAGVIACGLLHITLFLSVERL